MHRSKHISKVPLSENNIKFSMAYHVAELSPLEVSRFLPMEISIRIRKDLLAKFVLHELNRFSLRQHNHFYKSFRHAMNHSNWTS